MARYNSKRIYNRIIPSGGAIYNSAPFSINIFDYSNVIIDNIKNVTRNTSIQDSNTTKIENITFGFNVNVNDSIAALEKTNISTNLGIISDLGNIVEIISLLPFSINIADNNLTANETVNINSVIIYNDNGNGIDSVTYRLGTFYNTELSYNKGYNKGGANYNTSKQFVIMLFERGMMAIEAKVTPDKISMEDSSIGNDTMLPISSVSPVSELVNIQENFALFPYLINIDESGHTSVSTDIRLSVSFNDSSISTVDSTLLNIDVNTLDEGTGVDLMSFINAILNIKDNANILENVNLLPLLIELLDNEKFIDNTYINSSFDVNDIGNAKDTLSLPLMQINTSDNLSLTDLINIELSDINLIDSVLINDFTKISNDIFLNDENISAIDIVVYRSGVFYNTKLQYNRKLNDNGANYNSSKHLIIIVSESGNIDEKEAYVVQAYFVYDNGQGNDNSSITNELSKLFDNGISADSFKNIVNNVTVIDLSKLDFQEETMFARLIDVIDKIIANDYVRKAETHFIVDSDNILQPLGIKVAKVSEGILPFTKDYTEEIPGKHGEYYLKSEFKGKAIEFEVVTPDGLTPEVKSELREKIAKYLNPTKNTEKPLTFSDDLEKQYLVRYSGNIDIDNYPSWFKFVIPFKMSNPLIRGSFDNVLIGNGTITNEGNTNANMIININGLATNPTIELDGQILTYNGTIEYGQTVVIDTEKKTVMMDGINVLDNWCGIFPTLKPGNTNVIMNGNISIRWRNSWV